MQCSDSWVRGPASYQWRGDAEQAWRHLRFGCGRIINLRISTLTSPRINKPMSLLDLDRGTTKKRTRLYEACTILNAYIDGDRWLSIDLAQLKHMPVDCLPTQPSR
jgi:hypothetical protein